jgi:hypothetical protein
MLKKNILPTFMSLFLIFATGCVDGVGGTKPATVPVASQTFRKLPTNNPKPNQFFVEPLTEDPEPDPRTQFQSYEKILRALKLGDYDYVNQEFAAGGIKYAAIKADTEFAEYPLSSSARTIMQNIGQLGLQNKSISAFNSDEKNEILSKLIKQVFIYSMRGLSNRLIEYNKNGLAKDNKYSVDLVNNLFVYFYGNDSGKPSDNSIAQLSQTIDKDNGLSAKTFDDINAGLKQISASAKDNIPGLITGKNQLEKGLYKMLYHATLEKVALSESTRNVNILNDAEFYYIGIQKPVKVNAKDNNNFLDVLFSYRRLDLVDYLKFEKNLAWGFYQRATEEMKNAITKISTDKPTAINSALAAKLLIAIPNATYKNTETEHSENPELTNDMNEFSKAIQDNNLSTANAARDKINLIIANNLK